MFQVSGEYIVMQISEKVQGLGAMSWKGFDHLRLAIPISVTCFTHHRYRCLWRVMVPCEHVRASRVLQTNGDLVDELLLDVAAPEYEWQFSCHSCAEDTAVASGLT